MALAYATQTALYLTAEEVIALRRLLNRSTEGFQKLGICKVEAILLSDIFKAIRPVKPRE